MQILERVTELVITEDKGNFVRERSGYLRVHQESTRADTAAESEQTTWTVYA